MADLKTAKEHSELYIKDRHLYVSSIIKSFYNPEDYKSLCEVGAGDMELASILAKHYHTVAAYEPTYRLGRNLGISNLHIHYSFNRQVNMSKYDLLVSICPYCYSEEIFDEFDQEVETRYLLQIIVDMCLDSGTDLFLVLANTIASKEFMNDLSRNKKYSQIINDTIDLYFVKMGELRSSKNNLLVLKNK